MDKPENNIQTFYYTFGTDEFYPFQKGWVEVKAEDRAHANAMYRQYFPDRTPGVLNCSCTYSEEHFQTIQCMANTFPDWKICHAVITSNGLEIMAPKHTVAPKSLADRLADAKRRVHAKTLSQSKQQTVDHTR